MRYIGYDRMRQRRTEFAAPRRSTTGLLLPVLLALSVGLLVLGRLGHGTIAGVRWQVMELMGPVLRAAMVPLEPVRQAGRTVAEALTLFSENERLRNENQRLRGWQWRAQELERKFADLAATSKIARETEIPFVTARVIAHSSGAFVRSVMIGAGEGLDVKPGYPVLSGDGLIGRIVETGRNAARVVLLTDAQSRIPVFVGRQAIGAVLAGDNGPRPRIELATAGAKVHVGDEVSTSGAGGLLPRGLRIGTVVEGGDRPRVEPHAQLDTVEYLGVLFYAAPALDLVEPAPSDQGAAGDGRVERSTVVR